MGRATQLSHFVKYGKDKAILEVRLKSGVDCVVKIKRTFSKDDKATGEWSIDGTKSTATQVQKVIAMLNIQLTNLCQFLPQDKVFEFSRLDPVQLLVETQKAVARDELVTLQKELISLRQSDRQAEDVKQLV